MTVNALNVRAARRNQKQTRDIQSRKRLFGRVFQKPEKSDTNSRTRGKESSYRNNQ